jgi:DNA-binding transcriptional LysR family regulator
MGLGRRGREGGMNIQQLRYVVETADRGSMTAAATELFVAQPALSRAVRQLERELDITIFRRAGRGIVLTTQGEGFVARARRVLRSIDALRRLADQGPGSGDVSVVIAASPTLQASLALPLLEALREQGVAASARLLGCSGSDEVHAMVSERRADLGLCDQEVDTELDVVPLGLAEVVLVSPRGLDLPDPITVAQLSGVPLVLPTAGSDRRAALDWFFTAVGVTPTVAVESDERSVWLEAVRRGLASCIWHSVEHLRVLGPDVVVRGFEPAMHQQLTAVHRADNQSPVKVHLLEVLRDYADLQGPVRLQGSVRTAATTG